MESVKEILGGYRNPLILFIIYCVFFTIAALIVGSLITEQDISPFIFGTGGLEMTLLFLVMWPLSAIIGGVIISYFLAPVFLFIHKKGIGRKMNYSIQERVAPQEFKKPSELFFRPL
ncbi:MAG: hypothetical protein ACFFC7_09075 [Candidatus Hermodarchaeota archaeon]